MIDGAKGDESYLPGESFKGMQEPHLAWRILPSHPQRAAGTARQQAKLHSQGPATSIGRIPGWGGVEAGRALGGTQGAHDRCCPPVPWPGLTGSSFPPSDGGIATPQPTPALGPGEDGHSAVAKVPLLMAPRHG